MIINDNDKKEKEGVLMTSLELQLKANWNT